MSVNGPIIVDQQGRVAILTLNRSKVLNAINSEMMQALLESIQQLDKDPSVGCIVIQGDSRAFCAGADIAELAEKSWEQMLETDHFCQWELLANARTPKIAAVQGYALGGGCELAMMCDMVIAAQSAHFGQPEVKLGLIPGMGGTQRLTKLVGRAVASDLILTGRTISAPEALAIGLVSRVLHGDDFSQQVLKIAQGIAEFSKVSTALACESIKRAEEISLREGLLVERRNYHALWNTPGKQQGTQAFLEKKVANFHPEN